MGQSGAKFKTTIEAAIIDGYGDLEEIKSNLEDAMENMNEGTNRYAAYEIAIDVLDAANDVPDVPEFLKEIDVVYLKDTRARESKTYAIRTENAVSMLRGAMDASREHIGKEKLEEDAVGEAEELIEALEGFCDELDELEFP